MTIASTNRTFYSPVHQWCLALMWVICCLLALPTSAASDRLSPFSVVYHVHHSGARVGEMTMELSLVDEQSSTYQITSFTEPRGLATFFQKSPIVETSLFRWDDEGQQLGLNYRFNDGTKKGKRNGEINFDWDKSTATSVFQGHAKEISLTTPIADRLALKARITRDLNHGTLQKQYSFIDRDEIKTYQFENLGPELLDTPAGRFETIKIRQHSEGSSRSIILWLAKAHDYVTVKLMQLKDNKPQTVLSAKNLLVAESDDSEPGAEETDDASSKAVESEDAAQSKSIHVKRPQMTSPEAADSEAKGPETTSDEKTTRAISSKESDDQ